MLLLSAHRIQMLGRQIGQDHVKVQLWDVSGDQRYQAAASVLSRVITDTMLHKPSADLNNH